MDPDYARAYRALYTRHWWWRAREDVVVRALSHFPPAVSGPILDIGCGDGLLFEQLSQLGPVEGIEPDARLLDRSSRWYHQIHVRPFDSQFRPGHRFSRILMLDVLEHLADSLEALRHVRDLMLPGATFYCTVPAFMQLWTNHDVLNNHVTRFRKRELESLVCEAGLKVLHARYYFHSLVVPKLMVRAKESLVGGGTSAPRLPHPALNAAFYFAARCEQQLLGSLPVPFGSSIILVARVAEGAGANR